MGELPPTEGSANTEEFCEILRKFKLFSRGFRKAFAKFLLGVLLRNTHIFSQIFALLFSFRSTTHFSQLSHFSQLEFRSVSPSFANRVSQVSQGRISLGFANTRFAVLRLFRKIRRSMAKNTYFRRF